MNNGRTVFSQLIEFLPNKEFQKCVGRYRGDHYVKKFSCWDQFLSMAFAQLTYRDGLRDIEACLQSVGSKLYHMGFRSKIKKSTLADANELRDWRIYADFAQVSGGNYFFRSTTIKIPVILPHQGMLLNQVIVVSS